MNFTEFPRPPAIVNTAQGGVISSLSDATNLAIVRSEVRIVRWEPGAKLAKSTAHGASVEVGHRPHGSGHESGGVCRDAGTRATGTPPPRAARPPHQAGATGDKDGRPGFPSSDLIEPAGRPRARVRHAGWRRPRGRSVGGVREAIDKYLQAWYR